MKTSTIDNVNRPSADGGGVLGKVSKGRNFERAKTALVATQCVFCHRVGNDPSLPAGIFGPGTPIPQCAHEVLRAIRAAHLPASA